MMQVNGLGTSCGPLASALKVLLKGIDHVSLTNRHYQLQVSREKPRQHKSARTEGAEGRNSVWVRKLSS